MLRPAYNPKKHSIFETRHRICTACVGDQGIGDFETYAVGYFEATSLLLKLVTNPELCLTQDTLVYPILFNLRHAVELSIKHVSKLLLDAGTPNSSAVQNTHDLNDLWNALMKGAKFDRRLEIAVAELSPAVMQMHEADPLAQEFRFGERTDGVPSFNGRQRVDLVTVLELTDFAEKRFNRLFGLAGQIATERRYGSYTPELNRDELEQLSKDLPDASTWSKSVNFNKVKAVWMKKYQLSGKAFTRAIDFIKGHREFSGNIGLPKSLSGLDESNLDRLLAASIEWISEHWKGDRDWGKKTSWEDPSMKAFNSTGINLSKALVSEVCAIFYLGRDGRFSEEFEPMLEHHSRYSKPISQQALRSNFRHVFSKLNFAECMCRGLRRIGYPNITAKYEPRIVEIRASVPPIKEVKFPQPDTGSRP